MASGTVRRRAATRPTRPPSPTAFGLGDGAVLTGPVARGELGRVWRLTTSPASGRSRSRSAPTGRHRRRARRSPSRRLRSRPAPTSPARAARRPAGSAHASAASSVRVHEWVDLLDPDPNDRRGRRRRRGRGDPPLRVRRVQSDRLVVHRAGRSRPLGRARGRRRRGGRAVRRRPRRPPRRPRRPGDPHRAGRPRCRRATATCGPTTCSPPPAAGSASSTGTTAASPIRARSSPPSCTSSPSPTRHECRRSSRPTRRPEVEGGSPVEVTSRWRSRRSATSASGHVPAGSTRSLPAEEHARAVDRAVEFLTDRPLTIAAIDDILDAVHSR